MQVEIPDGFPLLVSGAGDHPETGGCVMQVASWLWNREWKDTPECVDKALRSFAICVNDTVFDADRNRLLNAVPDLMNTAWLPEALTEDEHKQVACAIEGWVEQNWPWPEVQVKPCECPTHSHDEVDLYCLTLRMEAAISKAHEIRTAIGGGMRRWFCEKPHDLVCDLPNLSSMARLWDQAPKHAHYTHIPERAQGSVELVDFFLAFVQAWVEAYGRYVKAVEGQTPDVVSLVRTEKWAELRDLMVNS